MREDVGRSALSELSEPMTKGRKRTKGVPDLHDELKTRVNLSLTPKAVEGLDARATKLLVSRSELVERIGRGIIPLAQTPSLPFSEKQNLPDRPGIGIVTSGGQIFYIAEGAMLKRLKFDILADMDFDYDKIFIVWIECSEPSWLPLIQSALLVTYQSQLHTNVYQATQLEEGSIPLLDLFNFSQDLLPG